MERFGRSSSSCTVRGLLLHMDNTSSAGSYNKSRQVKSGLGCREFLIFIDLQIFGYNWKYCVFAVQAEPPCWLTPLSTHGLHFSVCINLAPTLPDWKHILNFFSNSYLFSPFFSTGAQSTLSALHINGSCSHWPSNNSLLCKMLRSSHSEVAGFKLAADSVSDLDAAGERNKKIIPLITKLPREWVQEASGTSMKETRVHQLWCADETNVL